MLFQNAGNDLVGRLILENAHVALLCAYPEGRHHLQPVFAVFTAVVKVTGRTDDAPQKPRFAATGQIMEGDQYGVVQECLQIDFSAFTCAANVILVQVTNGAGPLQRGETKAVLDSLYCNAEAA